MRTTIILCLCLVFFCRQTGGPDIKKSWTLQECIQFGLENNISVKQYELARENQEINVETTKFSRLPDLTANLGQTFTLVGHPTGTGYIRTRRDRISSMGINTSVNLFSGFQVSNQLKAEKKELLAAVEI